MAAGPCACGLCPGGVKGHTVPIGARITELFANLPTLRKRVPDGFIEGIKIKIYTINLFFGHVLADQGATRHYDRNLTHGIPLKASAPPVTMRSQADEAASRRHADGNPGYDRHPFAAVPDGKERSRRPAERLDTSGGDGYRQWRAFREEAHKDTAASRAIVIIALKVL